MRDSEKYRPTLAEQTEEIEGARDAARTELKAMRPDEGPLIVETRTVAGHRYIEQLDVVRESGLALDALGIALALSKSK